MSVAALLESPQVLIAEEEKIIVEETKGDQTVVEEKYVSLRLHSIDLMSVNVSNVSLQCFDTVGWAAGRASGLYKN